MDEQQLRGLRWVSHSTHAMSPIDVFREHLLGPFLLTADVERQLTYGCRRPRNISLPQETKKPTGR
jgi:hypothetical protein